MYVVEHGHDRNLFIASTLCIGYSRPAGTEEK